MIVVCDASPIISLSSVGRFDLLRQLYEKICVPDAVYQEVTWAGERAGAGDLGSADWVERRTLGMIFSRGHFMVSWTKESPRRSRWPSSSEPTSF